MNLKKRSAELEQAILRIIIGMLVLVYLLRFDIATEYVFERNALAFTFLIVSSVLLGHILYRPGEFVLRKYVGIVNDIFFITASMFVAGQNGQPVYLVYLWVIFGNGFRFGYSYLKFALVLALIGFAAAITIVPYWQTRGYQGLAMLAGLALLSAYFGTLLNRLNNALKAQENANLAKRQFISSVSHELRTPLNAIIGLTDLLETTATAPAQREMLSTLKASSRLMHTLIDDVLDFSKIESGKIVLQEIPFDVRDLIQRCAVMFHHQLEQRAIGLQIFIGEDVPGTLIGDAQHLRQVILNLLSNAVKFTETGTITVRVQCGAVGDDQVSLMFDVEDTGIGIPQSEQAAIFDSFVQASSTVRGSIGGTGLGTTIARELVQLMGGDLTLRSEVNVGTVFSFTLPFRIDTSVKTKDELIAADVMHASASINALATESAATDDDANAAVDPAPADAPTAPAPLEEPSCHVLIADDNPTNRLIIQKVLERAGHTVTVVGNGDEALDEIEQQQFDAIVLDFHMPVLDGLSTLRAYRIMTLGQAQTPVIIFSADATRETEQDCLAAGVDAFMTKPIDIDRFLHTLAELTRRAGKIYPEKPVVRAVSSTAPAAHMPIDMSAYSDALPAIHPETLDQLATIGQTPDFITGLIDAFCMDSRANVKRLEKALAEADLDEFQHILHALRGSAMGIGAGDLAACCKSDRSMDARTLLTQGPTMMAAVRQEAVRAIDALTAYKKRHALAGIALSRRE